MCRAAERRVKRSGHPFRSARHRLRAVILPPARSRGRALAFAAVPALLLALAVIACDAGSPPAAPSIVPGDSAHPREVNLITKDYSFLPDTLVLVPGETVLLHVVNGGLEVHEAVIGDPTVQDAWEAAEAATVGAPPGPTPQVSVSPDRAGVRVVVRSGERVDMTWTIPRDASSSASAWVVGCHIPGHWARGMRIAIRWVNAIPAP